MTKKKLIAIVTAAVLVVCCAVAGTLAWLTDKTPSVTNTFTTSDINITLTETAGTTSSTTSTGGHEFKMVPGYTITKDPIVTVKAGSEACWLFVKVTESTSLSQYIDYTVASDWTKGDGTNIPSNVYYRQVASPTTDQSFNVIGYMDGESFVPNTVLVKESVTKAMMDALEDSNAVQPTLTFKAYAVQLYKSNVGSTDAEKIFTPAEAWAKVNP